MAEPCCAVEVAGPATQPVCAVGLPALEEAHAATLSLSHFFCCCRDLCCRPEAKARLTSDSGVWHAQVCSCVFMALQLLLSCTGFCFGSCKGMVYHIRWFWCHQSAVPASLACSAAAALLAVRVTPCALPLTHYLICAALEGMHQQCMWRGRAAPAASTCSSASRWPGGWRWR